MTRKKIDRNSGIGGSEIAAVAGLSPWETPVDVWARKVGIAEPKEDNPDMERGRRLEAALREWLADKIQQKIVPATTTRSPTEPIIYATPDGLVGDPDKPEAVVEIKSPRRADDWADPEEMPDGIPLYYLPQVIWEMHVTQVSICYVAALLEGDLRVYRVPYDAELFELLRARAREFWDYVRRREPPPWDGSPGAWKVLRAKYPRPALDLKVASPHAVEAAARLADIEQQLAILEAEKERLRQEICAEIGEHEGLALPDGGRITWRLSKDAQRIDLDRLRAEMPEVAAKYTITQPGSRRWHWSRPKKGGGNHEKGTR